MTSKKIFWIAFFPLMILNIIINVINVRLDTHEWFAIFMHCLSLVIVIAQVILVIILIIASRKEKKEKEQTFSG